MMFIRDIISSKILEKRKLKWLLCGIYHPPSQRNDYFFNNLDKALIA